MVYFSDLAYRLDWTGHRRRALVRQRSKWDYAYEYEKILDARLCMSITWFEVVTLMWYLELGIMIDNVIM